MVYLKSRVKFPVSRVNVSMSSSEHLNIISVKGPSWHFILISAHIIDITYGGKVKSSRPSLCEIREKRPLSRESDRSWCHRHTTSMIKLFWSQPMALWASGSSIRARWKVLGLAYNRRETRDKWQLSRDPDRNWYHCHTSVKLSWS